MPDHDPNGVDWQPAWKVYGYSSFEAYVESKAGACPPLYTSAGEIVQRSGESLFDAYMRTHREACGCEHCRAALARDWPLPSPPPYAADDEDDEAPDA